MIGLTELIEKVFKTELYNPLVRPIDPGIQSQYTIFIHFYFKWIFIIASGLTVVSTELKIIQIDIVFIFLI